MKRFLNTLFVLVLVAVLAFFAAMVINNETPRQTWQRVVAKCDELAGLKPPPSAPAHFTPTAPPSTSPTTAVTPSAPGVVTPQTNAVETPAVPQGPEQAELGAIYTPESTTFRVFSPTAKSVNVVIYDQAEGAQGRVENPLTVTANGIWAGSVSGNLSGKFYTYRLEGPDLDPKREVLDPYATNSVASSTRGMITALLPPLASGPAMQSPTDMIVYEMEVRDFTISPTSGVAAKGLYPGFTEPNTILPGDMSIKTAIDHLSELGVTDVQIMPTIDFANNESLREYNWGYSPVAYFSPEGMFATNINDDSRVKELRALIEGLHARGIGVILDVVYNHTGDTPLQWVAPKYYYRYNADGHLSNGSACGNEVRTEAPMARKLILDSLKYWTKEYGIDGFRFDFMALIDKGTMIEAEHELRAINPHIVLYGEPWEAKNTPLQDQTNTAALHEVPVGSFNSDFKDALKGSGDGDDPGFIQNGSRVDDLKRAMKISSCYDVPGQSINYMTCHDNLVLWDKLNLSMPQASDREKIETMKLGYLTLLTSQGVPFMHGGEEFARTKGGNNNSYNAPDSVNEVDWSLKKKNFDLFTYVRDVIAVRKAHPLFRLRSCFEVENRLKFVDSSNGKVLMFTLDGTGVPGEAWKTACVVLNGDERTSDVTLPAGTWAVAIDANGAETSAPALSGTVRLPPKSGLVLDLQ